MSALRHRDWESNRQSDKENTENTAQTNKQTQNFLPISIVFNGM
jgi:hypothetical protein